MSSSCNHSGKNRVFGVRGGLVLTVFVSVLAAAPVQAALIPFAAWHLSTDLFGGLKQSDIADDVYFAVGVSTTALNPNDTYEIPVGFHWATASEYAAIMDPLRGNSDFGLNTYYNRGGWSGYHWNGQTRHTFAFADTHINGLAKHAGNSDGAYFNPYQANSHAGLVLVKDVPGPASIVVFGLACLGLGVRRQSNRD